MMGRWSMLFLYGLVMKSIEVSNTLDVDVEEVCLKQVYEFIHPANELLEILAAVYRQTETPFRIKLDSTNETNGIVQFLPSKNSCKESGNVTCTSKHDLFFGQYSSVITVTRYEKFQDSSAAQQIPILQRNEITFAVKPLNTERENELQIQLCKTIIEVMSSNLQSQQNRPCITEVTPCNTRCSTDKPTFTDTHRQTSTMIVKTLEGFQVSDIVIASLSSFVGGVVCTLLALCVLRIVWKRKKKHDSRCDCTDLEGEQNKTKIAVTDQLEPQSKHFAYETLTGAKLANMDNEHTKDHVYLDIGSDPNIPYTGNSMSRKLAGTTLQAEGIDRTSNKSAKEQPVTVKGDHVYNVLKQDNAASIDEGTSKNELNEHTYSGLTEQVSEKETEKPEGSKESSASNNKRSSETHNYDEINARNGDETNNVRGGQDQECNKTDRIDDSPSADHAYVILQKLEQSDCLTAENVQLRGFDDATNGKNEDDGDDTDTVGHNYHTL